jgi:hypothetical protein
MWLLLQHGSASGTPGLAVCFHVTLAAYEMSASRMSVRLACWLQPTATSQTSLQRRIAEHRCSVILAVVILRRTSYLRVRATRAVQR